MKNRTSAIAGTTEVSWSGVDIELGVNALGVAASALDELGAQKLGVGLVGLAVVASALEELGLVGLAVVASALEELGLGAGVVGLADDIFYSLNNHTKQKKLNLYFFYWVETLRLRIRSSNDSSTALLFAYVLVWCLIVLETFFF